jgi:hypothetical protein
MQTRVASTDETRTDRRRSAAAEERVSKNEREARTVACGLLLCVSVKAAASRIAAATAA